MDVVLLRGVIRGELPSGQKIVSLMESNADGIEICTDEKSLIKCDRLINADEWIEKLKNIVHDKDVPVEYVDYCLHLINEIEAELREQTEGRDD